jgi:hypothetical protein
MTTCRRREAIVATMACAWLLGSYGTQAGAPLPLPDPSAPPVRVLLVMPTGEKVLERQVRRLERGLGESRGFLRLAETLDAADVMVRFGRYRRTLDDKGVTQDLVVWRAQIADALGRGGPAAR